ncbi:hypothetical protein BX600DRAFT_432547 [Xylariales sp. PMI_506]|nr:hypothetical protein BX600DRAFT_432547 [Xylariales sp. PMI_506]
MAEAWPCPQRNAKQAKSSDRARNAGSYLVHVVFGKLPIKAGKFASRALSPRIHIRKCHGGAIIFAALRIYQYSRCSRGCLALDGPKGPGSPGSVGGFDSAGIRDSSRRSESQVTVENWSSLKCLGTVGLSGLKERLIVDASGSGASDLERISAV